MDIDYDVDDSFPTDLTSAERSELEQELFNVYNHGRQEQVEEVKVEPTELMRRLTDLLR